MVVQMGEIALAACVSHSPGMTGFPELADPIKASSIFTAFDDLRSTIESLQVEAIVAVSSEHFTNFFVNNYPTFAIGTATQYEMPATDAFSKFLKINRKRYPGHSRLGEVIYSGLLQLDFDPSLVAGDYGFDESFSVPLQLLLGDREIPIVPVLLNAIHPPFPTLKRCFLLGKAISEILKSQRIAERVMMLATGGLSHWVGLPKAGRINQVFDEYFLNALATGNGASLLDLSDDDIDKAGNGAHEIRSWLTLAGATNCAPLGVKAYEPVSQWLTGTCVAEFKLDVELQNRSSAV